MRARQVELEQQVAVAEEYNDNLHEEVKGSPVTQSTSPTLSCHLRMRMRWVLVSLWLKNDDMEVNGPEDIPPDEEEDEELEPASDEDGGEIFDTDSEDDA